MADPQIKRAAAHERRLTEVVVGVLIRANGDFLLTTRPEGKVYPGYWEFPGGKQEDGESALQALERELHEELGIHIETAQAWRCTTVDYPHALVRLSFFKVYQWEGELEMREGQSFSWQALPVQVAPLLPGALPVFQWLREESGGSSAP